MEKTSLEKTVYGAISFLLLSSMSLNTYFLNRTMAEQDVMKKQISEHSTAIAVKDQRDEMQTEMFKKGFSDFERLIDERFKRLEDIIKENK